MKTSSLQTVIAIQNYFINGIAPGTAFWRCGCVGRAGFNLGWAQTAPTGTGALCVMTFNLRYASATPPNAWPQRRPVMRACIQQAAPDLIGTQEGLYAQLKDLAADLPEFTWIGLGRDGGKPRRVHGGLLPNQPPPIPSNTDHFWLSDTPNVIGFEHLGQLESPNGDLDPIQRSADRTVLLLFSTRTWTIRSRWRVRRAPG